MRSLLVIVFWSLVFGSYHLQQCNATSVHHSTPLANTSHFNLVFIGDNKFYKENKTLIHDFYATFIPQSRKALKVRRTFFKRRCKLSIFDAYWVMQVQDLVPYLCMNMYPNSLRDHYVEVDKVVFSTCCEMGLKCFMSKKKTNFKSKFDLRPFKSLLLGDLGIFLYQFLISLQDL